MSHWPTRTGLVTAHGLARTLKKILQKYRDLLLTLLTTEQMAQVDALIACCDIFIQDVPQYEPPE